MVSTRSHRAAVAAVRPSARLDGLAVELIAHIALYVGYVDPDGCHSGDKFDDLLALRCACRACKPAVRRAATNHALATECWFRGELDLLWLAYYGDLFGSGCRRLNFCTPGEDSPEVLNAYQSFVARTQGRLLEFSFHGESHSSSSDFVLELCRACPQLNEFSAGWVDADALTSADIDEFCKELSRLCPLLESVELSNDKLYQSLLVKVSPAESYQLHFPSTRRLNFYVRQGYVPTRHDMIEATVEVCVKADEVNLSCCTVPPALVDVLLRTPLKSRLRILDLSYETTVSQETVLRCAAGFEALCDLRLPEHSSGEPDFYRSLAQARPTLTSLDLGFSCQADDACLRMLCELLSLERLELTLMTNVTPEAVNIILRSPTAQTLRSFNNYETPILTSERILRLLRGCPRLKDFGWDTEERLSPIEDGANIDAINALLKSRGGEEFHPFRTFGPSLFGRLGADDESEEEPGAEGESEDESEPGAEWGHEAEEEWF